MTVHDENASVYESRQAEADKTTVVSIIANAVLLIAKIIGGTFGRSQALLADAINSLLDLVANMVVYMGRMIARKPPDREHRYGHGQADTLAAIFVAFTLLIVGGYIVYQAIHVIIHKNYVAPTTLATVIAVFTIVLKEILYRWTIRVGRESKSPAVIANAYDHRSDAYASLGALTGILAAQIRWPILDPIAGIWIALLIIRNAIVLIRENVHSLMGGNPEPESEQQVLETLNKVTGIKSVRDLKLRSMGTYLIVDIVIMVDQGLTVRDGHDIASECKQFLIKSNGRIQDVMVHVEPFDNSQEKR
jgi:cation diffusion facilitator family transporter